MKMFEKVLRKQKTSEGSTAHYHYTAVDSEGRISPVNPEPERREWAERWYSESKNEKSARYQEVIDKNNLNNTYSGALKLANDFFKDRGLEHDPIRVVNRGAIHKATFEAYGEWARYNLDIDSMWGYHGDGRAVVIEDKEKIAFFGDDYILGNALHEAAHSMTAGENHNVITETSYETVSLGSLRKVDLRKGAGRRAGERKVGMFLEEAFADYTRVRALRELGRRQDIEGTAGFYKTEEGSILMGVANGIITSEPGTIAFPAEFAGLARTVAGRNRMVPTIPGYAAYALELLNTQAPGLYEDFLVARQEPARQRDAIKKIENIQPGLYGQLRDLAYTERDFISGLKLVMEAVN